MPKLDFRRGVDGQRKLTVLKPLPPTSAGHQFELRNKVVGVYDKGKPGTVVETEQSIVDKQTGEVYSKTIGSGFLVGQGGWGGPKGEFRTLHALNHRTDGVVWVRPEHGELPSSPREEGRWSACGSDEPGDCALVPVCPYDSFSNSYKFH